MKDVINEKQVKFAGFVCGGVIAESLFNSDPWAYLMCYYLPDARFTEYKTLRENPQKWAQREADRFFKKYAKSAI